MKGLFAPLLKPFHVPNEPKFYETCLWLDTVKQFSPTVGYVACCRHPCYFFVCPIKAETEPEDCPLEVVAATTPSGQPST